MVQRGSCDIQIDTDRNRLYIILRGFLSDPEMQVAREQIIENVNKLSKGFDVVTDLSTFKPASTQGMKEIKQAQRYITSHGVGRIVRIVDNEGLASGQMVSSVAEADKKLKK